MRMSDGRSICTSRACNLSSCSTSATSPGNTNGVSTTRPSSRASPCPPYTHFSIVIRFIRYDKKAPHEKTSSFRHSANRQPPYRQLSGSAEELGGDPVRLRKHLLHRRPSCDNGLPAAR